jgi:hypothetical protein
MTKSCQPIKKLKQFKQSVCYPKAMATSKMYGKTPVWAKIIDIFLDNPGKN